MADTFTPLLNLRLQQTGGNDNTWGALLNTDTITATENAIAGRDDRTTTGGALDLSATPLVAQVQKFFGTLVSDLTVTIPNLSKRMLVYNNTNGAFAMLVKTGPGSAVAIPQGTFKDVYCDGANNVFRGDRIDVGEIKFFGGASPPAGFLECDGSAISRANYPDLFAAIGTIWGVGNGATTFNLPDFKTAGRFIRSRTSAVAVGTVQADTVGPHPHPGSGSVSGSVSLSIAGDGGWTPSISISDPTHFHGSAGSGFQIPAGGPYQLVGGAQMGTATNTAAASTGITATSSSIGNHTHAGSSAGFSGSISVTVSNNTGTTETRPLNASALACIRF